MSLQEPPPPREEHQHQAKRRDNYARKRDALGLTGDLLVRLPSDLSKGSSPTILSDEGKVGSCRGSEA
jgi:hypothetical protein